MTIAGERDVVGAINIKLIDFGISRRISDGECVQAMLGTPKFVAPDVINFDRLTLVTDMWSIGVITYILLSGASLFLGDDKIETYEKILSVDYSFDEYFSGTSDLAKDFIEALFVKDTQKRGTVGECMQHPWIEVVLEMEHRTTMKLHRFAAHDRPL